MKNISEFVEANGPFCIGFTVGWFLDDIVRWVVSL